MERIVESFILTEFLGVDQKKMTMNVSERRLIEVSGLKVVDGWISFTAGSLDLFIYTDDATPGRRTDSTNCLRTMVERDFFPSW